MLSNVLLILFSLHLDFYLFCFFDLLNFGIEYLFHFPFIELIISTLGVNNTD